MQDKTQNITAVILAGGQSTRLEGLDKGLIKLNNKALVQHLIERIQPQVSHIMISANRNIKNYEKFGLPVFKDNISGFAGPLAGIHMALQESQTEWILSVPADSPFIPADLVSRLSENIEDNKIMIPDDGKHLQPTFALVHKSLTSSLENFLQQGERKARVWMQQQRHTIVDFSDQADAFININTPAELQHAEQHLSKL